MRAQKWIPLTLVLVVAGKASGMTVCEVIDQRLELNGKQVEVIGHLAGGAYTGFFVCEKDHCSPCNSGWIDSWPSMIGLWSEGRDITKLRPELEKYMGKPVDIVVRGRLATRSGLYVINLPWRKDRPLGRYLYGGVAAAVEVSEIKVIPVSCPR